MSPDTRDAVTWTLTTFVTGCTIVALAVRFVLLPWLRDHLVQPVKETHRQVAENGHTLQDNPTIPDRLEDLSAKVDEAQEAHVVQSRDLAAMTRVLDEHLRWSDRWVDVVDRELAQLIRERQETQAERRTRQDKERNGE